jgi:splicing factor 3A subunit 3
MDYSLDQMTMNMKQQQQYQREQSNASNNIYDYHVGSIPSTNNASGVNGANGGGGTTTTSKMQSIINQQRKKRRIANPSADGYDLYSILNTQLSKVKNGDVFTMEEVFGKYFDLVSIHEAIISSSTLNEMFVHAMTTKTATAMTMTVNDATTAISTTSTTKTKTETTTNEENSDNSNNDNNDNSSNVPHQTRQQTNISYPDFCTLLQKGLATSIPEKEKLSSSQGRRKKYIRFLSSLQSYLVFFLSKVAPLLNIEQDVILSCMTEFDLEWSQYGGVYGWEMKDSERVMANTTARDLKYGQVVQSVSNQGIDLKQYNDMQALVDGVSADELKAELAKLGMKCGGTPLDRAKRLWMTKDTPLDQLPVKLFAKKSGKVSIASKTENTDNGKSFMGGGGNQRRIDIARLEVVVTSLLDQLRPTLDATTRRAERRLTQTLNEKEREMEEEISGAFNSNDDGEDIAMIKDNDKDDDDSDSDDEDAPIYNPKGVPLGWDGKPIPYWLFKLHGLNHFYPCEICGNESYRGNHNFEKHFAEAKHSYGMRCLGIPNTKHFHGVTKIEDAQRLWDKLQSTVNDGIFDGEKEEEYEDSHGNVLSRATYEDLARQGLL